VLDDHRAIAEDEAPSNPTVVELSSPPSIGAIAYLRA